jgi:hypothetical protein
MRHIWGAAMTHHLLLRYQRPVSHLLVLGLLAVGSTARGGDSVTGIHGITALEVNKARLEG